VTRVKYRTNSEESWGCLHVRVTAVICASQVYGEENMVHDDLGFLSYKVILQQNIAFLSSMLSRILCLESRIPC
jgi:hypothetical protein